MARLRFPITIFIAISFSAFCGFFMRVDASLISSDTSIQTLKVKLNYPRAQAITIGGGFVDRQYFIEPNIHVIEGWAIFPPNNYSLLISTGADVKVGGSVAFQRQDLAGKPGAMGFIFYGLTTQNSSNQWCVLIPTNGSQVQLGGMNC